MGINLHERSESFKLDKKSQSFVIVSPAAVHEQLVVNTSSVLTDIPPVPQVSSKKVLPLVDPNQIDGSVLLIQQHF